MRSQAGGPVCTGKALSEYTGTKPSFYWERPWGLLLLGGVKEFIMRQQGILLALGGSPLCTGSGAGCQVSSGREKSLN